jgi:hypothetical protein
VQSNLIDIEDVASESRISVNDRDVVSVYAAATEDGDWSGGVLAMEVSINGSEWFDASTESGATPVTLTADGGVGNVYVGDVNFARLVTTTAAGASRPIEVRWV